MLVVYQATMLEGCIVYRLCLQQVPKVEAYVGEKNLGQAGLSASC